MYKLAFFRLTFTIFKLAVSCEITPTKQQTKKVKDPLEIGGHLWPLRLAGPFSSVSHQNWYIDGMIGKDLMHLGKGLKGRSDGFITWFTGASNAWSEQ